MLLAGSASAATLQVGPGYHYKTIQSAVNDAKTGDTILVAAGTYNEKVILNDKQLTFQGGKTKGKYAYPKVNGFSFGHTTKDVGSGNINGFNVIKNGIDYDIFGGNVVRNNYISNGNVICGGQTCSNNVIMNNQFTNGGIKFYESYDNTVTGNTITKAPVGLGLYDGSTCTKISGNTFSYCKVAVELYKVPSCLKGNKYVKNTVNIKTGVN